MQHRRHLCEAEARIAIEAPVIRNGKCLGAVAVSGLSGSEDLEIAMHGIDAILASVVG